MDHELIGRISLAPQTVAPGQSVRVIVTGPTGEEYPLAGGVRVRINGVPGARQYLQLAEPGEAKIHVTAERDGKIESAVAVVHVTGADAPTAALDSEGLRILDLIHHPCLGAPPVLHVARSPAAPYVAVFSVARPAFPGGLSTAPSRCAFPETAALNAAVSVGGPASSPRRAAGQHDAAETPVPGGLAAEPTGDEKGLTYLWSFGDGTSVRTRLTAVEHDFEPALDPDREASSFDIELRVEQPGQAPVSVRRTLYVHNAYALCKRLGALVPRARSATYATRALAGWEAMVTIDNVEPFPLFLTSRVLHPMLPPGDDTAAFGPEERLTFPIAIPARGSTVVPITVPFGAVPRNAVGFAVTLLGAAPDGKPIRVETCFDIAAPDRASGALRVGHLAALHIKAFREAIDAAGRPRRAPSPGATPQAAAIPAELRNVLYHLRVGTTSVGPSSRPSAPPRAPADRWAPVPGCALSSNLALFARVAEMEGALSEGAPTLSAISAHLQAAGLLSAQALSSVPAAPAPVEGAECDPDNIPDSVADDPETEWVCQATPERREVVTAGRFVNARKGDIIVSPSVLDAPRGRRRGYSGIMTRNYDQITHSIPGEERVFSHPEPRRAEVMERLWQGAVTQSVEQALHGESGPFTASAAPGEAHPMLGASFELVPLLVIKPDPLAESKDPGLRRKLSERASYALVETGKSYYRKTPLCDARPSEDAPFWESPQLGGLYSHAAPLVYRAPRLEIVTVTRWRRVAVRGAVTGTVRYQGRPCPGAAVQLYDGKATFADSAGNYRLSEVPFGSYDVKATSREACVLLEGSAPCALNAPVACADVDLAAPPELFRKLTIEARIDVWDRAFAGDRPGEERHYRELFVGPFGTHGETAMEAGTTGGENVSRLRVVADWSPDRSITVQVFHTLNEGGDEAGQWRQSFVLAPGGRQSFWTTCGDEDSGSDHDRIEVLLSNEVNIRL